MSWEYLPKPRWSDTTKKHLPECFIDSAGTGGYHNGEKPDKQSINIAQKYELDITGDISRQLITEDGGDLISSSVWIGQISII